MKRLEINCGTGHSVEIDLTNAEVNETQQKNVELAWAFLRIHRNELLAASDWTQTADAPVDAAAWAAYRQALRDLPENTTDPTNPDWPTPPA